MARFFKAFKFMTSAAWLTATFGCSTLFPGTGGGGSSSSETKATGCSTATKHVAPGGYYVNGNTICTAAGEPHQLHGVDRPSMEWSSQGVNVAAADFQLMASWKANVVRIALNQDFWLPGNKYSDPNYPALVAKAVSYAEEAGMDVILDLHWSDKGVLGSCSPMDGCQEVMADANNSIPFWSQVAAQFKDDGRVFFELYNEPHDVSWDVWKSGGMVAGGWTAAGMQQLYEAVRGAGADNLVIVGGLEYAYDLSGVSSYRISGYNILYATHPYNNNADSKVNAFDIHWGYLTATDPVVVTEFGDPGECASGSYTNAINTYESAVISYADAHHAGWTAWAWYPGGCSFPALISDWAGTPTPVGTVVQTALAGYSDPAYGGKKPAPHDADGGATDAGGSPTDAAADGASP